MERWPQLRIADWAATRDTLHLWTQVVGKIRLRQAPMLNHFTQDSSPRERTQRADGHLSIKRLTESLSSA